MILLSKLVIHPLENTFKITAELKKYAIKPLTENFGMTEEELVDLREALPLDKCFEFYTHSKIPAKHSRFNWESFAGWGTFPGIGLGVLGGAPLGLFHAVAMDQIIKDVGLFMAGGAVVGGAAGFLGGLSLYLLSSNVSYYWDKLKEKIFRTDLKNFAAKYHELATYLAAKKVRDFTKLVPTFIPFSHDIRYGYYWSKNYNPPTFWAKRLNWAEFSREEYLRSKYSFSSLLSAHPDSPLQDKSTLEEKYAYLISGEDQCASEEIFFTIKDRLTSAQLRSIFLGTADRRLAAKIQSSAKLTRLTTAKEAEDAIERSHNIPALWWILKDHARLSRTQKIKAASRLLQLPDVRLSLPEYRFLIDNKYFNQDIFKLIIKTVSRYSEYLEELITHPFCTPDDAAALLANIFKVIPARSYEEKYEEEKFVPAHSEDYNEFRSNESGDFTTPETRWVEAGYKTVTETRTVEVPEQYAGLDKIRELLALLAPDFRAQTMTVLPRKIRELL